MIDIWDIRLMRPEEVAAMLRVHPKTVNRWALDGRLRCIRRPGGQRRYLAEDVEALMRPDSGEDETGDRA